MNHFPPRVLLAFALAPIAPPALVGLIGHSAEAFTFGAVATYSSEFVFGLPLYSLFRRSIGEPRVTSLVGGGVGCLGILALATICLLASLGEELYLAILMVFLGVPLGGLLGCVGGVAFWTIAFSRIRKLTRFPI